MEVLHFLETVAVIIVMFVVNFMWWGQDGKLYIDKEVYRRMLICLLQGVKLGFKLNP